MQWMNFILLFCQSNCSVSITFWQVRHIAMLLGQSFTIETMSSSVQFPSSRPQKKWFFLDLITEDNLTNTKRCQKLWYFYDYTENLPHCKMCPSIVSKSWAKCPMHLTRVMTKECILASWHIFHIKLTLEQHEFELCRST